MKLKQKPLIFLFVLIIVLSFILGVRYGQSVEKTNKIVDFVLSITPTKIPFSPTPVPYIEYKSKKWGLKFIYPANLEIKEDPTSSSIFLKMN